MKTLNVMPLAILSVVISSCASMAPKEDRQTVFIDQTSAAKSAEYNKAMAWLAKNFNNANHAIQVRDEGSGQIVANGNVDCNELRQGGDPNGYNLAFTLDFQAKDNKVRMEFADLKMLTPKGQPVQWANNQITDKSKADAVKPCLEPIHKGILQAINDSAQSNW